MAEGDQNTSFLYSADGDRLIRRDAEGTTLYLPGMEVHAATPTSMPSAKRYYSHGGATVAMRDATSLHWFVADHHGTNQVAINAATEVVERRYSTPFGGDRGAAPGLWPDDKGFVGGTEDDTGLTHLGAREYDPEIGRFISVDPVMDLSDPQQMNGYSYSSNNPTTWSDPSGEMYDSGIGDGGGAGGGASVPASGPLDADKVLSDKDKKDLEEAKKAKKKSLLDVIKEQGLAFLLDFFGITDIINCFTKGDVGACVNTLINLIPWGKVFKAGKAIYHGIKNAFKAYKTWQKAIRWADDVIRRTDELIALAQKKADEAAQALADRLRKQADDKPGGSCPVRNSFVPGTLVLMADGSRKPIEDIKLGEQVLATDPETGETGARQVDRLITGTGIKHLVTITIDTDGPTGNQTASVTATDGHPFWSPQLHLWIDAAALQPGQHLRTAAGTWVQITAITHHATIQTVHNLTIHDTHTYYVAARETSVLVHNCGQKYENLALGTRKHGLRKFADDNQYTHFLNQTRDDALASVRDIANNHPETTIHIRLDGFKPAPGMKSADASPADLFDAAFHSGGGSTWYTTEREMNIVGRSVRLGNRSWDSIKFYLNGTMVNIPRPSYLGG